VSLSKRNAAFTVLELLTALAIVIFLMAVLATAAWKVYANSSLAISANNIRALSAASASYLTDNNYTFWPYRYSDPSTPKGSSTWWFGFETEASQYLGEGNRSFDPSLGPLGGYVPASFRPDPSFKIGGRAFKPKFRSGYLGVGYNILLGGGWLWDGKKPLGRYWDLPDPGKIVVFSTSAQVNNFQPPATRTNPMLEEFYGLDGNEISVHFRHNRNAMVAFANGSAGFLPMDPTTLDSRAPKASVGRFAPKGSTKYLLPEPIPETP